MENLNILPTSKVQSHSLFTDFDIHLFREGKHFHGFNKFGSHIIEKEGEKGVYFAVWAPNAVSVSVICNENSWRTGDYALYPRWDNSGIWEGFISGMKHGDLYKYAITTHQGNVLEKADPYARFCEIPPKTSSIVWDAKYTWKDSKWLKNRKKPEEGAMSVYEVHLGSWKKDNYFTSLTYRELGDQLVKYVVEMGFTHVEFMPVMEHPYFPSWGYQVTGYFAPSSRFGTPEDFKYMIDKFHEAGIGVLVDWVPSHFPEDAFALAKFDGTCLYEHEDPRKGFHPDWKSLIFNTARNEVKGFLISNALFWLEEYHIDGIRVDAVASMLYLDYSREDGEWIPNEFGGNENTENIQFLRELNEQVFHHFPTASSIAEESTAWSGVSQPTYLGGLGFSQKWMMGWMHDTLDFFGKDPIYRKYHLNDISFSMVYAFTENFMLPLSHDEVVHGKGSLISRMPGDEWQKFANLRLLYSYMFAHVGTKLLFMGSEIGQTSEWSISSGIEWWLTKYELHSGVQNLVKDLNKVYKEQPALFEQQFSPGGFEWISHDDSTNSIIAFVRKGNEGTSPIIVILNFTPVVQENYEIGVPLKGGYKEIFNSDSENYSGSNVLNARIIKSKSTPKHGKENSITVKLPPLGCTMLVARPEKKKKVVAPKKKVVKKK